MTVTYIQHVHTAGKVRERGSNCNFHFLSLTIHTHIYTTRQSKHCGFTIYIFDDSKSKSMVRLVRAEKMVLSGLVFARKIARMTLIQNI